MLPVGMVRILAVLLAVAVIIAVVVRINSKKSPELPADTAEMRGAADSHLTQRADQLKEFKALLDAGAITREEYDEKKRDLLGL